MEESRDKNTETRLLTKFFESKFIAFALLFTIIAASVVIISMPKQIKVGGIDNPIPGQQIQDDIYTIVDFVTENYAEMERKRNELKETYPYYYKKDEDTIKYMTTSVKVLLDEIVLRYNASVNGTAYPVGEHSEDYSVIIDKVKNIDEGVFVELSLMLRSESQQAGFMRNVNEIINGGIITPEEKKKLPDKAAIILSDSFGREVKCDDGLPTPAKAAQKAAQKVSADYDKNVKGQCEKVFSDIFNLIFQGGDILCDDAKREARMTADLNRITSETRKYFRGDCIFKKGQILTDSDIKVFRVYEKIINDTNRTRLQSRRIFSSISLCLAMMVFVCIYIYNVHPEVAKDNKAILLLVVISILALLADRIFTVMFMSISLHFSISPQFVFLALPLGFAALVTSALLGLRTAIYVGLFVSAVASVALMQSFPAIVTGLLVSGIAGTAVRNVSDYKKFFVRAFFSCSLTNLFLGMVIIGSSMNFFDALKDCLGISAFSGMCTAILAIMVLFLLDSIFSTPTNMAYLAVTDRNGVLLKRLLMEAPGTYHHSERVATIGENAAVRIGANPLRVQACALYHDVGKLSAPEKFTENSGGTNILADHTPKEAADIILQHVSYGLELARRYKLREPLRRVIASHHGTDFISFLYEKAKEAYGDKVKKEDFRYPGPLPVDKEEVIIALADCCEAALKSKQNPTKEDIQNTVNELFKRKLLNGQLSAANITMAELREIKLSFIDTLTAMSSVRIAYPSRNSETTEIEL